MDWRVIRRFPDAHEDVSAIDIPLGQARVGFRFRAEEEGKVWEVREVREAMPNAQLVAELVDDDRRE
jgi:hypothetical protein